MSKGFLVLLCFLTIESLSGAPREIVTITNQEGVSIEAEVLSVVETTDRSRFLCFRKPKGKDIYLYPFTSLNRQSLEYLSVTFKGSGLVVADGLTGPQLDMLEEYLAASPRERLVLELRDARKTEALLEREWSRLQAQTNRLQMQLAQAKDPTQRAHIQNLFRQSLRARDRTGKQLVLLQAEIRRMEDRIEFLKKMGIPIEDDPFAE
tara:strand:+ start:2143 stop:2763 length:621 start_codon:yes stop_codon:yes gene_type:complete